MQAYVNPLEKQKKKCPLQQIRQFIKKPLNFPSPLAFPPPPPPFHQPKQTMFFTWTGSQEHGNPKYNL